MQGMGGDRTRIRFFRRVRMWLSTKPPTAHSTDAPRKASCQRGYHRYDSERPLVARPLPRSSGIRQSVLADGDYAVGAATSGNQTESLQAPLGQCSSELRLRGAQWASEKMRRNPMRRFIAGAPCDGASRQFVIRP